MFKPRHQSSHSIAPTRKCKSSLCHIEKLQILFFVVSFRKICFLFLVFYFIFHLVASLMVMPLNLKMFIFSIIFKIKLISFCFDYYKIQILYYVGE